MTHAPRRKILKAGAALAAASVLPGAGLLPALRPERKAKRAIVVVFGGGVRTRDTLGSGNTPNLDRIAAQGVVMPKMASRNIGHFGATLAILTGGSESFGIREVARPKNPTLFERVRKDLDLRADDVWLSTPGSEQESGYSYSLDRSYGIEYGANLIGAEGVFNEEFKQLVGMGNGGGLPPLDPEREAVLRDIRKSVRTPLSCVGGLNDAETNAKIEAYLIQELRSSTTSLTGLGVEDVKSLHVARALLSSFRPTLLGVTLRTADIAHESYNSYVSIIKRCDDELGKLHEVILADPELRDSTALFVMPEFGRDRDLNSRRGLDHGDGSNEMTKVALVAWGPDFKRGAVIKKEAQTIDVAPTVLDLLGCKRGMDGKLLKKLYA